MQAQYYFGRHAGWPVTAIVCSFSRGAISGYKLPPPPFLPRRRHHNRYPKTRLWTCQTDAIYLQAPVINIFIVHHMFPIVRGKLWGFLQNRSVMKDSVTRSIALPGGQEASVSCCVTTINFFTIFRCYQLFHERNKRVESFNLLPNFAGEIHSYIFVIYRRRNSCLINTAIG